MIDIMELMDFGENSDHESTSESKQKVKRVKL